MAKKRNPFIRTLIILVIPLVVLGILQLLPFPDALEGPNPWTRSANGGRPLIIGHGGAKAMRPPNTIMGFDYALNAGADVLEMDVCLTKDGILVTHHDLKIDRLSDGTGAVQDYSYEELQQFNFGHNAKDEEGSHLWRTMLIHIPSLESVLQRYKDKTRFIIEIKDRDQNGIAAADELMRLLQENRCEEQTIIATFHDPVFEYLRQEYPDQFVAAAKAEGTRFVIHSLFKINAFYKPKCVALQFPTSIKDDKLGEIQLGSDPYISRAASHGLATHYWTINDPEEMKTLIEAGADGIMTDKPALLAEVLEEMGY